MAFGRDFGPLLSILHALGAVDMRQARCLDVRDEQYVQSEARRVGYGAGLGALKVNEQLRTLLRGSFSALCRSTLAMHVRQAGHVGGSVEAEARHVGVVNKEIELVVLRASRGDTHPATLTAINTLAGLHKANGDLPLAEALYRECLQSRRAQLGSAHPTTLTSLSNLGTLRYEQGQVDEALSLISEAFASRRRELGALAPPTLNSLNKLGVIHRAKADYANAVACGQQALDGRRQVLGVIT